MVLVLFIACSELAQYAEVIPGSVVVYRRGARILRAGSGEEPGG